MKKLILFLCVLGTAFVCFGKENKKYSLKNLEAGSYLVNSYAVGDLSEYIVGTMGLGACANWKTPLPFLGTKVMFDVEGGFLKKTDINSWCNVSLGAGAWTEFSFKIKENCFRIRPEFCYGVVFQCLDASKKGIESVYTDQFLKFGASLRYSPEKVLKKGLDFEFAPFYKVCPEKNNASSYLGFSLGVFYKIF